MMHSQPIIKSATVISATDTRVGKGRKYVRKYILL
jgi:hypothetical protein